jgi:hypothetical protein
MSAPSSHRILVPLDGSAHAGRTDELSAAVRSLLNATDVRYQVLHIATLPVTLVK